MMARNLAMSAVWGRTDVPTLYGQVSFGPIAVIGATADLFLKAALLARHVVQWRPKTSSPLPKLVNAPLSYRKRMDILRGAND